MAENETESTPQDETAPEAPLAVPDEVRLNQWNRVPGLGTLLGTEATGWNEVRDYFSSRCVQLCHNVLVLYWELGMTAEELSNRPGKYNSHTMENFAEFIGNQLRGRPYEVSSARKWRRFFQVCSQEEAQRYADWRLGWSQVATLIALNDETQRTALAERVVQGTITDEELQAEVTTLRAEENTRAAAAGGTTDRRGGMVPRKVFKGMASLCVDVSRRLDTYVQAYEEFGNMDEDSAARANAAAELQNAQQALRQTQDRINHVLESVHENGAATE